MRNTGNDQNRTVVNIDQTSSFLGLGKSSAEKAASAKEVESKAILNAALAQRLGKSPASSGGTMQKIAIATVVLTGIIITVMLIKK